ncbi:zinc-binding alcohol dehydrogenase family protein [Paenibacillus sp. y28]|uniref:zinc-binding alcohol dehydrogenase family protein n=1 Tax=Paenibacillus sp. y28 TaxID=3129110 RepID=UPI0030182C58
MKRIVCEEPNRFGRVEVEAPGVKPGEALVRIKRIGICGTDIHAFKGNQPYFTYPRVLGHELAGVIELAPDNELGIRAGDQVAVIPYMECGECLACRRGKTNCCTRMQVLGVHTDGGMQELLAVPLTHLLPAAGLTLDEAALLEPMSIGAHAVRRSGLQAGEYALVIGAGPIGLGIAKFAAQSGAKVIMMDVNEERLEFCRQWAGAAYTVNALEQPVERIAEITGGEFPSVVLDATGNVRSMSQAVEYTAHGGTLVYVGLVKADIVFSHPEFHKRELTLMGSRNATREDFDAVLRAMKSGSIDTASYITHRASFEEMPVRFEQWLDPAAKVIKAMVEV